MNSALNLAHYPRLLCLLAAFALLSAHPVPAAPAALSNPTNDPAATFLQTQAMHTMHIRVSAHDWELMKPIQQPRLFRFLGLRPSTQPAPSTQPGRLPPNPFGLQFIYIPGAITLDGQPFSNVALRFKGNSSYQSSRDGLKHSVKVDFKRLDDGGNFRGLTELNFNNNAFDDTQMREALSYALFRAAGVPASRTAYAAVHLTVDRVYQEEFLGLYTIVEQVDKRFLKSRFGTSKGLLLKPELRGRGLVYIDDDWKSYQDIYPPKTDAKPKTIARFIEFLKLVEKADAPTFARQIDSYLDVDNFIRFLAVTTLLANGDSFLSTGHNFYLYLNPDDGKVRFIPWDLNMSFAGFPQIGAPEQQIRLSITHPHTNSNKLIERLLAIDHVNKSYRQHLQHLATTAFQPATLLPQIDDLQALLAEFPTPAADTLPRFPRNLHMPPIKSFITARIDSVLAQLAGRQDGYLPVRRPLRP